MKVELTKSGKPVSEKTFGSMVCSDKSCRHLAVELGLFDPDLRLFGRYLHFNGYKTIAEARAIMEQLAQTQANPFVDLKPKVGEIIDFQEWKNKKYNKQV
ncbi:hypothetical protein ACPV36_03855 [Photobacterium damselae]|uniref:hypothetical protein n=1 Tax=Photobacterium damselae TaxID=38293 RepID=UPI00406857EC